MPGGRRAEPPRRSCGDRGRSPLPPWEVAGARKPGPYPPDPQRGPCRRETRFGSAPPRGAPHLSSPELLAPALPAPAAASPPSPCLGLGRQKRGERGQWCGPAPLCGEPGAALLGAAADSLPGRTPARLPHQSRAPGANLAFPLPARTPDRGSSKALLAATWEQPKPSRRAAVSAPRSRPFPPRYFPENVFLCVPPQSRCVTAVPTRAVLSPVFLCQRCLASSVHVRLSNPATLNR